MNFRAEEEKFKRIIHKVIPMEIHNLSEKCDEDFLSQDIDEIKSNIEKAKKLLDKYHNNYAVELCLYYNIASSYNDLRRCNYFTTISNEKLLEKEILNYRKAIEIYESVEYLIKDYDIKFIMRYYTMRCYTNIGNSILSTGRYIFAIDNYNNALLINSNFAMATLNLSMTLYDIAKLQIRNCEVVYFLHAFYYFYQKSKECQYNLENIRYLDSLEQRLNTLDKKFIEEFLKKDLHLEEKYYKTKKEQKYRNYIQISRLFLNPCIDILGASCFDNDNLILPFGEGKTDKQKELIGLFNQIKVEYIYSRYIWYESTVLKIPRYNIAEKDIGLVNIGDNAVFKFREFMLRNAFKSLYSIFDKIALFLNEYFSVGLKGNQISFKNIWKEELKDMNGNIYLKIERPLKENLNNNIGIRALYWLQKDLVEDEKSNITNPNSIKLFKMRNDMEHNALRTIKKFKRINKKSKFTMFVLEEEIEDKTYKLLKLLREAIIYLTVAVKEDIERRKSI